METRAQDVRGYYVWEPPGKPVAVHLRLDVVDRLAAEVMRGFGAVPKRGAEVGGVLLGTIQNGFPAIVRVEDFEPVACDYRRGPSYQFTEDDRAVFEDACRRWQPSASPSGYAVGYFRSHTRDGFSLDAEDSELLDRFFASPFHVALLIQPYATKVSVAGFFAREHGVFPETTPLEFPLRCRELTGEEPPPRRTLMERRPRARDLAPPPAADESYRGDPGFATSQRFATPQRFASPEPAYATAATTSSATTSSWMRNGWVWIPLSFISLLLGVVLGFQTALTMGTRITPDRAQDFSLALSVTQQDDNLSLKWDRQSPAIRFAQKGLLEIEEGGNTKPVDLDAAQLQNGTLIYRNSSNSVRFRLTVYPSARGSITETLNWKR